MTVIHTDGGCSGNPGPGGWAWAATRINYDYGFEAHTTNQRMELMAVLEGLKAFCGNTKTVEVVSDSSYVVNCFRDKWYLGWHARDWKTSAKKPVANRDLWEPLIEISVKYDVKYTWVKGHSGNEMNDFVDLLAVSAYKLR